MALISPAAANHAYLFMTLSSKLRRERRKQLWRQPADSMTWRYRTMRSVKFSDTARVRLRSAPRVRPGWDTLQPSLGLSLRGALRSPAYGPRPGSPVGRASHLGKRRSQVSSAVEDAVDRHLLGADVEGNGNPHLEADHAQPGPDVVASGAPLRKVASRRQAAWMRST